MLNVKEKLIYETIEMRIANTIEISYNIVETRATIFFAVFNFILFVIVIVVFTLEIASFFFSDSVCYFLYLAICYKSFCMCVMCMM